MFDKVVKYIVYVLSLLIIIAFFAVIYGIYIKISPKASKNSSLDKIFSLSLMQNQEIKNIQVINNSRILIIIDSDDEIQGLIFDIEDQKIIQRIIK